MWLCSSFSQGKKVERDSFLDAAPKRVDMQVERHLIGLSELSDDARKGATTLARGPGGRKPLRQASRRRRDLLHRRFSHEGVHTIAHAHRHRHATNRLEAPRRHCGEAHGWSHESTCGSEATAGSSPSSRRSLSLRRSCVRLSTARCLFSFRRCLFSFRWWLAFRLRTRLSGPNPRPKIGGLPW